MFIWIEDTPSTAKHTNQIDIFTSPGYILQAIFYVYCLIKLSLLVILIQHNILAALLVHSSGRNKHEAHIFYCRISLDFLVHTRAKLIEDFFVHFNTNSLIFWVLVEIPFVVRAKIFSVKYSGCFSRILIIVESILIIIIYLRQLNGFLFYKVFKSLLFRFTIRHLLPCFIFFFPWIFHSHLWEIYSMSCVIKFLHKDRRESNLWVI